MARAVEKHLQDYYKDCAYLDVQYLSVLHTYGVSGKIAGVMAALAEIQECVVILHGPQGCAYHYRYAMRSRYSPLYYLESTMLQDRDIIFGGEDRLTAVLTKVVQQKPKIIAVVPTCVSDVMGEDLEGIVRQFVDGNSLTLPIIVIKSEEFSHPNKISSHNRLKERVWQNQEAAMASNAQYKGCGFIEVLLALVTQVMQPQVLLPNSVNIESFGWGYGATAKMQGVITMLAKMGTKVNCLIPTASYEQLQRAPRAQLNIVRRIRWAQRMEKRFGTPYLHVPNLNEWVGLQGIEDFYLRIAYKLENTEEAIYVLNAEKEKYLPLILRAKEYLNKFSYGLIISAISSVPEYIKIYTQEYGIPLAFIIVIMPPSYQEDNQIDNATMEKMLDNINVAVNHYGLQTEVVVNPSSAVMKKLSCSVDYLIGNGLFRFTEIHAPLISELGDYRPLDFEGYVAVLQNLEQEVRNCKVHKHLLLKQLPYHREYYPLLNDKNTLAAKEMWARMWRRR